MAIGDPITQPIPPVGSSGTGYATAVNAFLTEVKARLEAQIPLSAVLTSVLDMQNNPIQNLQYAGFYPQASPPTSPVGSIQYYGNEFYLITPSGAVQVTAAGSLNAASLGGITGDYGGLSPAQWRYVAADETFYGYRNYALSQWAHVQGRDFQITGAATGSARLRLTWSPGSSYTITFPTAAPGSTAVVQMDSSGNLTASNTVPALTSTDFKFTSARTRVIHGATARPRDSNDIHPTYGYFIRNWAYDEIGGGGSGPCWRQSQIGSTLVPLDFPVAVELGETITGFALKALKFSSNTQTITASLYRQGVSGAGPVLISTNSNSANTGGAQLAVSIGNTGLSEVVSATSSYFIRVTYSVVGTAGANTDVVVNANITYTRP